MDARFDLNGTAFVWDTVKASRNERKHGVRFEQAAQAFFDPFVRLVDASRGDEERDAVIGYDESGRLLYVVHLLIEERSIRVISARQATSRERKAYDS
jgi:hypothetical protein